MSNTVRRLAERLTPPRPACWFRTGVIVSYASGRATVTLGGDTTNIPNVPCVYVATAGDNVRLLQDPQSLVVLCKLT